VEVQLHTETIES